MQISETRIKLVENRSDRLKAFCSITFDNSFVIRDLKIIEGTDSYFVAMPSRKLTDRCPGCGSKNHLRARYCNDCGNKLQEHRDTRTDPSGRTKLHADVAHPVNTSCREYIQDEVVKAYKKEIELSEQPGYKPTTLGADYEHNYIESDSQQQSVPPPSQETTSQSPQPPQAATDEKPAEAAEEDTTDNQQQSEQPDQKNPSSFGEGIF